MGSNKNYISDGKAKDMILEYALNTVEIGNDFCLKMLKQNLFPDKSLEDIKILVTEINDYGQKTLSVKITLNEVYLLSKGNAKSFLKNNSFEKIENKIKSNERKERYDYLFSKYRYMTYWVVFSLGLFGGIYSIYDIFIKTQSTEEKLEQIEKDIQENKEAIKELHTLPLIQKGHDSLYDSKTQPDSLLKK